MKKQRIKKTYMIAFAAFVLLLTFYGVSASAGEDPASFYKGKKMTLVVTSSPGGGYDVWCRLLAPSLEKATGTTIIVQNVPGAGGTLALHKAYRTRRADGLEIVLARAISTQLLELLDFPGTSARWASADFGWIGRLTWDIPAFAANKKFKSINDVRADSEFLVGVDRAFGTAGTRTALAFEALGLTNGKIVAGYPGSAEYRMATMLGELDGTSGSLSSLLKYFAAGDLNPLWVINDERVAEAPDVPTIYQLGVVNKKWLEWLVSLEKIGRSLLVAPNTPKDRIDFLRKALVKAVADPDFQKKLKLNKFELLFASGEEVEKLNAAVMKINPEDKKDLKYIVGKKYIK